MPVKAAMAKNATALTDAWIAMAWTHGLGRLPPSFEHGAAGEAQHAGHREQVGPGRRLTATEVSTDDQHHPAEAEHEPDALPPVGALTQQRSRCRRDQHRLEGGDQCCDPGGHAFADPGEDEAEVDDLAQHAEDGLSSYGGGRRQLAQRHQDADQQQRQEEEAPREESVGRRGAGAELGTDEPRAPHHDEPDRGGDVEPPVGVGSAHDLYTTTVGRRRTGRSQSRVYVPTSVPSATATCWIAFECVGGVRPLGEPDLLVQRVHREPVVVSPAGRARTLVRRLAGRVLRDDPVGCRSELEACRVGRDVGDDPVVERAARRIRVRHHQRERCGVIGDVLPLQRWRAVRPVAAVARRDRLTVLEDAAGDLNGRGQRCLRLCRVGRVGVVAAAGGHADQERDQSGEETGADDRVAALHEATTVAHVIPAGTGQPSLCAGRVGRSDSSAVSTLPVGCQHDGAADHGHGDRVRHLTCWARRPPIRC